jgi:hypothetical protein
MKFPVQLSQFSIMVNTNPLFLYRKRYWAYEFSNNRAWRNDFDDSHGRIAWRVWSVGQMLLVASPLLYLQSNQAAAFFALSFPRPRVWLYSVLKLSRSSVHENYCVFVHFFQHVWVIRNNITCKFHAYFISGESCTIFPYLFTSTLREQV